MIPDKKIKEVQNYLNSEFSGKILGYQYDSDRKTHIIMLSIEDFTVYVTVLEEFFEDNKVQDIRKKLKEFRLKEFIRHGRSKRITVTKFGLKLEDY